MICELKKVFKQVSVIVLNYYHVLSSHCTRTLQSGQWEVEHCTRNLIFVIQAF